MELLGFPSLGARDQGCRLGQPFSRLLTDPEPRVLSPLVMLLLSQNGLISNNLETRIMKRKLQILLRSFSRYLIGGGKGLQGLFKIHLWRAGSEWSMATTTLCA